MMKTSLTILLLLLASQSLWAYNENHGPFEADSVPASFSLKQCTHCPSTSNDDAVITWVFAPGAASTHRISVSQPDDDSHHTIEINDTSGNVIMAPKKAAGFYVCGLKVYYAFLNEDDKPDYLVETWSSGCGLAGGICFMDFMLSNENGYSLVTIETLFPDEKVFVDLNKDKRPELIHTAFVRGEQGKDGKTHNYWVYNLLRFKGDKIVSANEFDARFPRWVWYTFKPNHKNTKQLTADQKKRLWKEQAKDLFPNADSLADEQAK